MTNGEQKPKPKQDEQQVQIAQDVVPVPLQSPITRKGGNITTINLRKPKGIGPMRGLKTGELMTGDVNSVATLLTRISEPPLAMLEIEEQLDPADWAECCGVVRDFFMSQEERDTMERMIRGT